MDEAQRHLTTERLVKHLEAIASLTLDFVESDEFIEAYKNIFSSFRPADETVRPPLAGSSREALKIRDNVHKYVINEIRDVIKSTVELECLDELFRKLHQMKLDSKHCTFSSTAWRPPGNAETHMKPFKDAIKTEVINKLKGQVTVERAKLNILQKAITISRNTIQAYDKDIKQSYDALKKDLLCLETED